jgi:hypothetical protein
MHTTIEAEGLRTATYIMRPANIAGSYCEVLILRVAAALDAELLEVVF